MPKRNLNIAISTFNFPKVAAVTKSPDWHAKAIEAIGADGILGSHIHNVHPQSLAQGGLLKALVNRGLVERVHESWRSKKVPDLATHYRNVAKREGFVKGATTTLEEALLIGALPHITDSLGKLSRLQQQTTGNLAAIVHPQVIVHPRDQIVGGKRVTTADLRRFATAFPGRLHYQPTAELLDAWNIQLDGDPRIQSRQMQDRERDLGLGTPVFDLGFLDDERDGKRIGDPTSLLRAHAEEGRVAWVQAGWRPGLAANAAARAAEEAELEQALGGWFAETQQAQWIGMVASTTPGNSPLGLDFEVADTTVAKVGVSDFIEGNRTLVSAARSLG